MENILNFLEIIGNCLLLVPKALLALFPLYNTLSSFKQDLIAAALGVSPIFISIIVIIEKIIMKQFKTSMR